MALQFNLTKGLLYGITLGLLFGVAIYVLASNAYGLGFIPVALTPTVLAGLVFGNGILSGVSWEYGKWLKESHNYGLMFCITNGFLVGITFGIYFGIGIFVIAGIAYGLGWLTLTPVEVAGIVFGASILMFITNEYADWLDRQKTSTPISPTSGTGPPPTI
jgi:hypothetical protein